MGEILVASRAVSHTLADHWGYSGKNYPGAIISPLNLSGNPNFYNYAFYTLQSGANPSTPMAATIGGFPNLLPFYTGANAPTGGTAAGTAAWCGVRIPVPSGGPAPTNFSFSGGQIAVKLYFGEPSGMTAGNTGGPSAGLSTTTGAIPTGTGAQLVQTFNINFPASPSSSGWPFPTRNYRIDHGGFCRTGVDWVAIHRGVGHERDRTGIIPKPVGYY